MIKIVCVQADNYLDRGIEYVKILADMIHRNMPHGVAYQFICFTNSEEIIDNVEFRPLHGKLAGWWNKLYLFKDGHFNPDDRIVFFDLDTIITGDLTNIISYGGEFAILRDFYRPHGLGSGIMAWKGNWGRDIWEEYERCGFPEIVGGDQSWIERCVSSPDILQDIFPGEIVSYKVNAQHFIPSGAKIVAFHGTPKPHECNGWVSKFWKVGGANTLDQVIGNTDEENLIRNIEYSTSLSRTWLNHQPENERHAVIVGGGPSLKKNINEIMIRKEHGQDVFSLNNSWEYLNKNGIESDFHVMLDAREENKKFINPTAKKYYSSQCDQAVWDEATDAILWNHLNAAKLLEKDPRAEVFVAGGSTVGLNAICIAYIIGYRNIHIYGFDSSYDDGEHHAYSQDLNDKERVISVEAYDKQFITAAWMAEQVNQFCSLVPQLIDLGCVLTVHGEGLLPYVARNLGDGKIVTEADLRATAINERIKDISNPVGVEVGVFTGELSRRLLKRDDLTLYMVDSWIAHDPESEYGKNDFHGKLSEMEQERYYQHTKLVTSFAGSRAKVIRKSSLEASSHFADQSLDFVFLDADHSYESVKKDIEAWLPKIKSGGWISGHDYDNIAWPTWGVKKAVDELGKPELGLNFTWFIQLEKSK
jgi:uncharacterized Rossmann fold enzyme